MKKSRTWRDKMFTRNISRFLVIFTILSVVIVSTYTPSPAQYFGRNKVQYDKFDFKIMKTQHFDVYFYPEMEESANLSARMAERWYARLSRVFNPTSNRRTRSLGLSGKGPVELPSHSRGGSFFPLEAPSWQPIE